MAVIYDIRRLGASPSAPEWHSLFPATIFLALRPLMMPLNRIRSELWHACRVEQMLLSGEGMIFAQYLAGTSRRLTRDAGDRGNTTRHQMSKTYEGLPQDVWRWRSANFHSDIGSRRRSSKAPRCYDFVAMRSHCSTGARTYALSVAGGRFRY